jgi:PPOX class probable F420-dependent enzyme
VLGKNVRSRLRKDLVIWLVTVGPDGRPHAVPVWFWWDGDTFLIYSVPGQKVRDIKANRNVELHFNTDPEGDEVMRADGTAGLEPKQPPAYKVPAYVRKYRAQIKGFGWTPKVFSDQYHVAIRVRPTRFH